MFNPGKDAAHSSGVSLYGFSMYDGLPTDRVIMVVENKGHKGGPLELGQGCIV